MIFVFIFIFQQKTVVHLTYFIKKIENVKFLGVCLDSFITSCTKNDTTWSEPEADPGFSRKGGRARVRVGFQKKSI